jgi:hypothetical protein
MRHLPRALGACVGFCVFVTAYAGSGSNPLGLTIDLLAPATPPCNGSSCPSDIDLPELGAAPIGGTGFTYSQVASNYVTGVTLDNSVASPIVCDEISGTGPTYTFGPATHQQFSPSFTNPSPGSLLEFGAGGPSVVDLSTLAYDGSASPAALSLDSANTASQQVGCYPISAIGAVNPLLTRGTSAGDRIFYDEFDAAVHFANEPWVSVQTVYSPSGGAGRPSNSKNVVSSSAMGYVLQVHNASHAIGWHVVLGYDYAFFDPAVNGGVAVEWCLLDSSIPQPGPVDVGRPTCNLVSTNYTVSSGDIQTATNSLYVYVQFTGSNVASNSWGTLVPAVYPATGAVFAPPGKYAQRLDDKVAVASANNLPAQNVGSIVCPNDPAATSCMLYDADSNGSAVTYVNLFAGGAVTVDPVAYFVDPNGGTTLPGNSASDVLAPSPGSVSCVDPSHILASPIGSGNFSTSGTALGAQALAFAFATSGSLFVPGTATCTATFNANGFSPVLSATQTFTITMLQATATHFAVIAPPTAVAGTQLAGGFTVTAQDAGNNTVTTYSGTVQFTSTDGNAVLPANSTLVNGVGTFNATLKSSGNQTIKATDTVQSGITGTSNAIAVAPASATHFLVNAPANVTTAIPFSFTVTAQDPYNNTDTNYSGTVQFTSTDSLAVLPPNSTLVLGLGTPSATLITIGPQTITATDTNNSSINGMSGAITVGP